MFKLFFLYFFELSEFLNQPLNLFTLIVLFFFKFKKIKYLFFIFRFIKTINDEIIFIHNWKHKVIFKNGILTLFILIVLFPFLIR